MRRKPSNKESEVMSLTATSDTMWSSERFHPRNVLCEEYWWNSGRFAPATIRLRLNDGPARLTRIALQVEMWPENGRVDHEIRAGLSPGSMRGVGWFEGSISSSDWIEIRLDSDAQYIDIVTNKSPSFVAWRRIKVWRV